MFVLRHWEQELEYSVEKSGFCIHQGRLYLSVQCVALSQDAFPPHYLFAASGLGPPSSGTPETIELVGQPEHRLPSVYVYTTFHASEVEATITIAPGPENQLGVALRVATEDPNYYDQRAQRTVFEGSCVADLVPMKELWLPA